MATTKVDVNLISATGTPGSGNFLRGDGTWNTPSSGLTMGTEQATTSGDTITFSSIPSGTTFIVMGLDGVSLTGAVGLYVQIGDSGGLETTGYNTGTTQGTASAVQSALTTDGFRLVYSFTSFSDTISGSCIMTKQDATNNSWVYQANLVVDGTVNTQFSGGIKSLSAELDRVALFADGTLDAGAVNIAYM